MSRRRHRRFRIAVVVIVALLLQQVTLAAYACNLPQVPAQAIATATATYESCAAMDMQPEPAPEHPPLCEKHCAPDRTVAADHAVPGVPPLALPPMTFAPAHAQAVPRLALQTEVALERSDPPPRLRYCSLLI